MNVSKNQLVCARCHLAGLASGQDCTMRSSGLSGAVSASVCWRTAEYWPVREARFRSSAEAGGKVKTDFRCAIWGSCPHTERRADILNLWPTNCTLGHSKDRQHMMLG